jgi:hypothetical protein
MSPRKWETFFIEETGLVKALNKRSADGWEIFSVLKDAEFTAYPRYMVVAYTKEVRDVLRD